MGGIGRLWVVVAGVATTANAAAVAQLDDAVSLAIASHPHNAHGVADSPTSGNWPGFRAWSSQRCDEHYRLALPQEGASIESCVAACRGDEQCAKVSLHLNSSDGCFMYDAKAECETAPAGWVTVHKDGRCDVANQDQVLHLRCPFGMVISEIKFASFGTPAGDCGNFSIGSCHEKTTEDILSDLCLGENDCSTIASNEVFEDACPYVEKSLAAEVVCSAGPNFNEDTYFNAWSSQFWPKAETEIETRTDEWTSFLSALPDYPADRFSGRGIVVVAGGRYLEPALVMIKILRQLGCTLRIQVWHLGKNEMTDDHKALLLPYNVETRDFTDYVTSEALQPIAANVGLRLFQLKPLALLHTDLEEVLLLDSDNCPIRDPSYLFKDNKFQSTGTIFWPDFWKTSTDNPIWKIVGQDSSVSTWEQESGQLLLKKSVAWLAINLAVHLNSDFYMKLLNGDKDTFRFAWMASNTPYFMVETWPTSVGTLKELHTSSTGFCGHTMLQHDLDGQPLFVHHNQLKSASLPVGENFRWSKHLPQNRTVGYKAVPVLGLQLPQKDVLPCIDIQGAIDQHIDDDDCTVHPSGLEEFEKSYFAAKASLPVGILDQKVDMKSNTARQNDDTSKARKFRQQEISAIRLRRNKNTTCSNNQFELLAPTLSMDRLCETVTTCSDTQVVHATETRTSDRMCRQAILDQPKQFIVRVTTKSARHPASGTGSSNTFQLSRDGGQTYISGASVRLTKLETYEFVMNDVSDAHPFILTLDSHGGWSTNPYTIGVVGSGATGSESLSFTPSYSTPSQLYYQSHREADEGGLISIVDPTFQDATRGKKTRFSTAYSKHARIFTLGEAQDAHSSQPIKVSCTKACQMRPDCKGIFVFEAYMRHTCYGLNDVSGNMVPTSVVSESIRKVTL